jgi:hypothetical protein
MSEDRDTFIEYITGLCTEQGETALLLRQKPVMQNGEMVYHADGAPKATFPAFIPESARIKDGQAWYVNTGSFIIDRFESGKVSAKASNVEFVLFMMLDDVGTKAKEPPLAPTWIMETSEGSFQWGYAFSDQPTKHQFTAAMDAIAEAGYTDPGALNAVRNCRIPGSVNLKQGRNNFETRLVSLDTSREYTLEQICTALDVTPAEADTSEIKSFRIRDTGQDNVLAWLSDNGMVLSDVNQDGWCAVVCPNHHEHTDGTIEGRYKPLDRSYCCYHGHCQHLDSRVFLAWVAENGGPSVSPGLRDELIAERMRQMADKIQPNEEFPDEAAAIVKEVERKEAGRLERNEWFERFAYIQSDDSYFDLATRRETSRAVFNALFRHVDCRSVHNKKRQIAASTYFDERRQEYGAKALIGITYAAGEDVMVARDGLVYGNRWVNMRPDMSNADNMADSDISIWLDHCRTLVPEEAELQHIFDVMACKVQNPKIKVNHAILHGGDEGSGKDTMWAPFLWAIGGKHQHNRSIIENKGLESQWGYGLEAEIVILNELKEPEARERRALANRLKPIIAAPPETLTINRKGLHPYELLNRLQVIAFTNDPLPITLPSQDRRWFCVWSHAPRMRAEDAAPLWRWYETGGYEKIAAWMWQRDVAAFNPAAAPPVTEWKLNMVEHGLSVAESFLVELMIHRVGPFASGVVGAPFHKLCDAMVNQGLVPAGVKVPIPALLHSFKEAGWIDCGRLASAEFKTKKHIYAAPAMAHARSKSDLRRMVETIASDDGKVVGIR